MRGVVLAGGTGSRLFPLTKVTNKHLLPVGDKPMLLHPIFKLRDAGITEICIVTGTEHMGDIVNLLGSGHEWGCDFTFRVQDQAGGIAEALGLVRHFAAEGPICVILGDNIFEDALGDQVEAYDRQGGGGRVLLKQVPDPQRYGVATMDGDKVTGIVEKPTQPASDWAVTGIYFYDSFAFEVVDGLEPSARGELEITDVNNAYIAQGTMTFGKFRGWWTDAGTFPSYHHANQLLAAAPRAPDRSERPTVRLGTAVGVPRLDLAIVTPPSEALDLLDAPTCRRLAVFPVNRIDETLVIAMADPSNIGVIDELREKTHLNIEVVLATLVDINDAIQRFYVGN